MRIINSLLITTVFLSACAGDESSRYRDTAELEKPPILAPNPEAPKDEEDTSTILKQKDKPGLGDDVYLVKDTPQKLKIKRSLVDSWKAVGLVLKQSEIVVVDRDHDNATYTVKFDPDNFTPEGSGIFGSSTSFLKNEYNEASYVLSLKADGSETVVTAALDKIAEQESLKDSRDNEEYDPDKDTDDEDKVKVSEEQKKTDLAGADLLLQFLYKTLHDDLKEE